MPRSPRSQVKLTERYTIVSALSKKAGRALVRKSGLPSLLLVALQPPPLAPVADAAQLRRCPRKKSSACDVLCPRGPGWSSRVLQSLLVIRLLPEVLLEPLADVDV